MIFVLIVTLAASTIERVMPSDLACNSAAMVAQAQPYPQPFVSARCERRPPDETRAERD